MCFGSGMDQYFVEYSGRSRIAVYCNTFRHNWLFQIYFIVYEVTIMLNTDSLDLVKLSHVMKLKFHLKRINGLHT